MDRSDDAVLPGLFDGLFASATEWGRLMATAREVRGADAECLDELLAARGEGGSLSRADAEKVRSLARMLASLDLDAASVRRVDPALMTALESACLGCADRARCGQALAGGTASGTYREFCPNAPQLDALTSAAAATR